MMLNVTFKGEPYLYVGESLDEGGPLTQPEDYKTGRCSYAHFVGHTGRVMRFNEQIGTREDIVVLGPADEIPMDLGDVILALDNMLGGDPQWFRGKA